MYQSSPEHDRPFRTPPHSLDAEQALLGAILINSEAHDRVSSFLEPHHFFDELHAKIYEIAARLIAEGKRVDPITLKPFFETAELIRFGLSVPAYLGQLAVNATTIINARDYGRTIYDLATRRQLIVIGEDMVNAAYDSPVDFPPKEQVEEVERRLYALVEKGQADKAEVDAPTMLDAAWREIEAARQTGGAPIGLSTGLSDLDRRLGGLRRGHLIIIGGRPSMGKTALAANILEAQAGPALFYSMEMTSIEVALRQLAGESGLASDRLTRGDLDQEAWRRLVAARTKLRQRPLTVDQTGGLTIAQLSARARRMKRQRGIEIIVVDYLQLMQGSKRGNRVEDVTEITTGLKALAKELNIPVVALSQLSRKVEERPDKRPQLADLRESGSIEQDADVVLFVFRQEYYVERDRPTDEKEYGEWMTRFHAVANKAEIIIAKNRHGPVGTVDVQFDGPTTRFSNLARNGLAALAEKA
jgi:replicative DNA helicase